MWNELELIKRLEYVEYFLIKDCFWTEKLSLFQIIQGLKTVLERRKSVTQNPKETEVRNAQIFFLDT